MNYEGPLYGKIGRRFVPLKMTSQDVDALERELCNAREALKEHCFFATKKDGFSREGYTLETDSNTAYRDIEYRDCRLFSTSEEAVNYYLSK